MIYRQLLRWRRKFREEFAVVLQMPAARLEQHRTQLVQLLRTPVVLDDGRTVDVAAPVGAATPDGVTVSCALAASR